MTFSTRSRSSPTGPARGRGKALVAVLCGGAFAHLSELPDLLYADVIIRIDVPNEIAPSPSNNGQVCISLAEGKTLKTLIEDKDFHPHARVFLDEHPAIDTQMGLAQFRPAGVAAIQEELEKPEMTDFLMRNVFERLLIIHNGDLQIVTLLGKAGSGGGTGGPALLPFLDRLRSIIQDHTDAIVHTQLFRIASGSHIGNGPRLFTNEASTFHEDLAFITSPRRDPREVRSLRATQIPIVGRHKDRRDRFTAQLVQATEAPRVREHLELTEPNDAFTSRYGNMTIFDPAWGHDLPDPHIAAEIAGQYRQALEQLGSPRVRSDLVQGVEVQFPWSQIQPAHSAEAILSFLSRPDRLHPDEFEEFCLDLRWPDVPPLVEVQLHDGTHLEVTQRLRAELPANHASLPRSRNRMLILRTIDAVVESRCDQAAIKKDRLDRRAKASLLDLQKAYRLVVPELVRDQIRAALTRPSSRTSNLKRAIRRAQQLACQVRQATILCDALTATRQVVQAEWMGDVELVKRILKQLDAFLLERDGSASQPLVIASDLDSVFGSLMGLAAANREDPAALTQLLVSSVDHVTLTGLARIVGAPRPTVQSIADRLAHAIPPIEAPCWGFRRPSRTGATLMVLPPLNSHDENALRQVLQTEAPAMLMACSDLTDAGVNVVRLRIIKPEKLEEIFTPFMDKHLAKARAEAPLFLCGMASHGSDTQSNGALVNPEHNVQSAQEES